VAAAQASSPPTVSEETAQVDLKRLQDEIGANGAHMGQGLKSKRAGSPRSGKTESFSEMVQTQNTWQAPGIQGLDVSSHQPTVDWPAQYSMGARFAYVKASEGLTYRSPTFNSQYTGAQSVGMLRGAYHFALPSISTGAAQADYFVNSGGGWSPDGKTMPPLLDIEYNPYSSLGNTCYNMSASAMVNWIKDFSNRILARTGRLPMIYTTTDWWTQCTGNSGAFGNHPLHLASYSTYVGNMPNGWGTYSVWQYSSTGPFAGDSNAWNGSYTGLQKFASTADGAIPNPSIRSTGDVVAADSSGALWDYPATGTGGFGTRKQIGQGWTGLRSINVIDWNADGVLDIVAQWTSGRVNVYFGVAAGGFSTGPVLASSGWDGYQLTIGYWLSGSYYPQILTRDDGGSLTFWRNSSGGSLGTASKIGTGWGGLNLTMIDFDGDGNEDLLAQDPGGTLRQYRSNGSGAFVSESRPEVGSGWNQMTSVTVTFAFKGNTSSGIMGRTKDGTLKYYPVPGDYSWGASSVIGTGWNGFLIAGGEEINLETAPPPVEAKPSIQSVSDLISVDAAGNLQRQSAGNGSLGPATRIGFGFSNAKSFHVADWNADKVLDLVVQWNDGRLNVYRGRSGGGFEESLVLAASGWADSEITVGRWIRSSPYPVVLRIHSDGTLARHQATASGSLDGGEIVGRGFVHMHPVMADYDGDGSQDLGVVNYIGQFVVYRSGGSGTFISESRPVLGSGWSSFDSVSSHTGLTSSGSIGLMARDAAGSLTYYPVDRMVFGTKKQVSSGWQDSTLAGSANILRSAPLSGGADVLTIDAAGRLWNYPATGAANTGLGNRYQIGVGWSGLKSLHVADWDSDGTYDVVSQWSSGTLKVYFGSANGGFSRALTVGSAGWAGITFVAGSWERGSRYPGLVGINAAGGLYYWANSSGTGLTNARKIGSGWTGLRISMTDFDSDGNQDLLATDSAGLMRLFRSNGTGNFLIESRKTVGSGWSSIPHFSAKKAYAGAGSQGVLAVLGSGQTRYYPIENGAWRAPIAGTMPVSGDLISY
jgi:GH25 family lysozyme M1 (1,4-beta-N-acetylmuramidase)